MLKIFDRNNNIAILIAGIFSIIIGLGVARFAFTGLIPAMLEDYLSIKFVGILASLNFAGYLAGSIFSMFVKDINVKVYLYRLGVFLAISSTFVLAFSDNNTFWMIARVLGGFAGAMCLIVGTAIVMQKLTIKSKTKAMGIHFSGIGFSILTTDLIARFFLSLDYTWRDSWTILAIFALVLSFYSVYILSFDKEVKQNSVKVKFDFSLFTPFVIVLIMAYFAEGIGFVVQATFLPDIINNLPGLEGYGSITWTLVGLAGIPSCIIWMLLAHRFGSSNIIIIALLLQAVGILIPVFSANIYLNFLSGILYGGTFIGLVALFMNLGGQLSKGNPVVLMGAMTSSYGIGQVVAPLYSIYFIEKYGNYDYALILTAIIVIGGAFILLLAKKFEPSDIS
ncbi:YbfB/YjiJ family MFS transporter [Arcobacter porcinus]|uniref:Major Facilitator Superfamily protein n=1 Tax=Arcobacter porcinus TaxID=1935204 RepID=A0A1C0AX99_9BACT|nr:YbfB/YjiJ family MFS transporter [Arcobacter porcinus]OCL97346.1 Major Facilitator Superfamily protein [Aliarcobacter thereius]OCL84252.1 Major Facilitator Superfamily protein [Arcobacter porcinus]OCL84772.1 Major Facilitator Superfamily protein [Arcobacter porcinus]OCL89316.1 Major Facilitator Superfamily protein [Arcobacter porcinus]OCL91736.1 Major Facilitator Superfamily protein [Arcobacter porcinus]